LYQSATEYWQLTDYAYDFNMSDGTLAFPRKSVLEYGWAVTDGYVPLPGTVLLMGLGLVSLGVSKVRRRGHQGVRPGQPA